MLNGINLVASRDDLLDRSILFRLDRIDEEKRMEESAFWQQFEKDRPLILGALFDAVSKAMRIYPSVKLDRLPRMADFATWVTAGSIAFGWPTNHFIDTYRDRREEYESNIFKQDKLLQAIIDYVDKQPGQRYKDTANTLLMHLRTSGFDLKTTSSMSNLIYRLGPNLRKLGYDYKRAKVWDSTLKKQVRIIEIWKVTPTQQAMPGVGGGP